MNLWSEIQRTFTVLNSEPLSLASVSKPFSEYQNDHAIVILGDPGAGKTTLFEGQAQEDDLGEFITLRQLRRASDLEALKGKTLFIDALDEVRARARDGLEVIDELISRLEALGKPKFRLSCRAADWYGNLDEKHLSELSPSGDIRVLHLDPLTEEQISCVAKSEGIVTDSFIQDAEQIGILELLKNPQNLHLLIEIYSVNKQWPESRSELFELASRKLSQELNETYARHEETQLAISDILNASGFLACIYLCADIAGFSLSAATSIEDYPALQELNYSGGAKLLGNAVKRRLFRSDGQELVAPIHRTLAEYLAARYLVACVRKGLPFSRILSMIMGFDGGTLSELRGLYAWITSLYSEGTIEVLERDPIGLILYGDVSILPSSHKEALLENLRVLSETDPWFRAGDISRQSFGALACNDLEESFRKVLHDPNGYPRGYVYCVLDAISYGQTIENLKTDLIGLVKSTEIDTSLAESSIRSFSNVSKSDLSDLVAILKDICNGKMDDPANRLRGVLLETLYPQWIEPKEVINCIGAETDSHMGAYENFFSHRLNDRTDDKQLVELLDALVTSEKRGRALSGRGAGFALEHSIGDLLLRGLETQGDQVPEKQVYRWLGIPLDEHGHSYLGGKYKDELKEYFSQRPEVTWKIFTHWLEMPKSDRPDMDLHYFWERLGYPERPKRYGYSLLEIISSLDNKKLKDCLFLEAASQRADFQKDDSPTLEEFQGYVKENPEFRCWMEISLEEDNYSPFFCVVPNWRWEEAKRRSREKSARKATIDVHDSQFLRRLEEVRRAKQLGILNYSAKAYHGLFRELGGDSPSADLMREIASKPLVAVIIEGMEALLYTEKLDTPSDIAKAYLKSSIYEIGYSVIAGVDLVAYRSTRNVLCLPEKTLYAAVCYQYTNYDGNQHWWFKCLCKYRPIETGRALFEFWSVLIQGKRDHIPGLYQLTNDAEFQGIAREVAEPLLRRFPTDTDGNLYDRITGVYRWCSHKSILTLAQTLLQVKGKVKGRARELWYGVAFLLSPEECKTSLARYIGTSKDRAERICQVVQQLAEVRLPYDNAFDLELIKQVLSMFAKHVPLRTDRHGFSEGASGFIVSLTEQAGGISHPSVRGLLDDLVSDPAMSTYIDRVQHVRELHVRQYREAQYIPLSVSEVNSVIRNEKPISAADLWALTRECIKDAAINIRNESSNGYRAYWNNDSKGKLTTPKWENDCRDRLLERIKPELAVNGVAAEREGSYVEYKRSDIKVLFGTINIPVEIKRHYHKDLWHAATDQLVEKYTRDPATSGYGIFVVFWFGEATGRRLPKLPAEMSRPSTAQDLETALKEVLPNELNRFVDVICIDCEPPAKQVV